MVTAPPKCPNRKWFGVRIIWRPSTSVLVRGLLFRSDVIFAMAVRNSSISRLGRWNKAFKALLAAFTIISYVPPWCGPCGGVRCQMTLAGTSSMIASWSSFLTQPSNSLSSEMKVFQLSERMSVGIPLMATNRVRAFVKALVSIDSVTSRWMALTCRQVKTSM